MLFITGDTHSDFKHRFNTTNFPEQKNMCKDDFVLICGDFGGIWNYESESKEEKHWLDWFEERSYTLLFIDGNHENFDRLYNYPEKEWHGGKVHVIRPHVLHLMRGQIFEIEGKTIFTFGGAKSHDTQGGILEQDDPNYNLKKKRLSRDWIPYRVNHLSWWKEEIASIEEMEEGCYNLSKHDNEVDYIVTHCCSTSTQSMLAKSYYGADQQTDYLDKIKHNTKFRKWFFGHYHDDGDVSENETLVYEKMIKVL